jgi:hypothetical protein
MIGSRAKSLSNQHSLEMFEVDLISLTDITPFYTTNAQPQPKQAAFACDMNHNPTLASSACSPVCLGGCSWLIWVQIICVLCRLVFGNQISDYLSGLVKFVEVFRERRRLLVAVYERITLSHIAVLFDNSFEELQKSS